MLIVSAGALALLILYNLTNINVSERFREIATIKVLGFYDREVLSYVYRENFILAGIGMVLGIFLGMLLHTYIITTVEVNAVMFGRDHQSPELCVFLRAHYSVCPAGELDDVFQAQENRYGGGAENCGIMPEAMRQRVYSS